MTATRADFEQALASIFRDAEGRAADSVEVRASDLHRAVGGYPGRDHRMPVCCDAMRRTMTPTDLLLTAPPKGHGASLRIRYDIPRPDAAPVPTPEHEDAGDELSTLAFQRLGAPSNTQVGADFENAAVIALAAQGVLVERDFAVSVGIGRLRKKHKFDLGSASPPILAECKSHRWTTGDNAPSAKLAVWNEAMYYFAVAPIGFRKIFFVLRDFSSRRGQTLAEHYLGRFLHLVPEDVEFWEYNEATHAVQILDTHSMRRQALA